MVRHQNLSLRGWRHDTLYIPISDRLLARPKGVQKRTIGERDGIGEIHGASFFRVLSLTPSHSGEPRVDHKASCKWRCRSHTELLAALFTSPFTHAPPFQPARSALANSSMSVTTSTQEKAPQYHFPYQYPSGAGYPGYGLSASPGVSMGDSSAEQPGTAISGVISQTAPGEDNAVNEEVGEGSKAWEAAQAILKAISDQCWFPSVSDSYEVGGTSPFSAITCSRFGTCRASD